MVKIILYDIDGVLIHQTQRFSQRFAQEFNIPQEKLDKFFNTDFPAAAIGQADLITIIKKYLIDWDWHKSAEQLLHYWFTAENYLEINMIESILAIKALGIKVGVVSNQEKYRAAYLSEEMGLGELMDYQFYSCDLGYFKSSQEFWDKTYTHLPGIDKKDILVWDDKISAVESARQNGFQAELFTDFPSYEKTLDQYVLPSP